MDKKILKEINESVQIIKIQTTEIRANISNSPKEVRERVESSAPSQQQYADVIRSNHPKPTLKHIYSRAAILLKRRTSTTTTLNTIRDLLNRKAKAVPGLPKISCYTARDRNTLIIQAENDEETEKVLEFLDNISTLKDIAELTYKSTNMRKIIILGIPEITEEEEITGKILEEYNVEVPIEIHRRIQRAGAKTYQLVLNIEANMARILQQRGRILIGFNSCRVEDYRPVIRCGNCQAYGHTKDRCRYERVCAFCTGHHSSETCKLKEKHDNHKCINCQGARNNFPHAANSSKCPAFKFYLTDRNNSIKRNNQNST